MCSCSGIEVSNNFLNVGYTALNYGAVVMCVHWSCACVCVCPHRNLPTVK